jgi:hypothetical protein
MDNTTGIGVGYAYVFDNDNNTALTAGLGMAGDEVMIKVGVGFELGGDRVRYTPAAPAVATYSGPTSEELATLQARLEAAESALEARITQVEATQNVYMDSAARVERLEGAAHNPAAGVPLLVPKNDD